MNLKECLFEAANGLAGVIEELDRMDGPAGLQEKVEAAYDFVRQAEEERRAMLEQIDDYIRGQE